MTLKRLVRNCARTLGYEISRYDGNPLGRDKQADMRHFVKTPAPVVFDVGANVGQSIDDFKRSFPRCVIHSFEPCASTFEKLAAKAAGIQGVIPKRLGLGRKPEQRRFVEYTRSHMNSFLEPGQDASAYGQVKSATECEISSVDAYCAEASIPHIDILKSDAQGLDLEVLEGSVSMMSRHRIHLVYIELLFSKIYQGQASAADILKFMEAQGFRLVSFYRFIYLDDLASWSDALFVDPKFQPAGGLP